MLHTTLIVIHTITALVAFVLGGFVVFQPPRTASDERVFHVFFASLIVMVVFMLAAIVVDWSTLESFSQAAFAALGVLGIYMVVRAFQARNALAEKASGWEKRFIDHVGFTLIALFDGFIIISALDLNLPAWLIAIVAVAAVLVGITIVNTLEHRAA